LIRAIIVFGDVSRDQNLQLLRRSPRGISQPALESLHEPFCDAVPLRSMTVDENLLKGLILGQLSHELAFEMSTVVTNQEL
jgi:hypothetical protein